MSATMSIKKMDLGLILRGFYPFEI